MFYERTKAFLGNDECCGVVFAVQHWRPYLWGKHFKCVTNHAALTHLYYMQDTSNVLTRWAIAFQGFDFTVEHKPGKLHIVPDTLSRLFGDTPEDTTQGKKCLADVLPARAPGWPLQPSLCLRWNWSLLGRMDTKLEVPRLGGVSAAVKPAKRKANAGGAHPPAARLRTDGAPAWSFVSGLEQERTPEGAAILLGGATMHPQQLPLQARPLCDRRDWRSRTASAATATTTTIQAA